MRMRSSFDHYRFKTYATFRRDHWPWDNAPATRRAVDAAHCSSCSVAGARPVRDFGGGDKVDYKVDNHDWRMEGTTQATHTNPQINRCPLLLMHTHFHNTSTKTITKYLAIHQNCAERLQDTNIILLRFERQKKKPYMYMQNCENERTTKTQRRISKHEITCQHNGGVGPFFSMGTVQ